MLYLYADVAVSENPVLKADAIKYLMVFRNQVPTVLLLLSIYFFYCVFVIEL